MKLGKTRSSKDDHKKGGKYIRELVLQEMQMYLFIGWDRKTVTKLKCFLQ